MLFDNTYKSTDISVGEIEPALSRKMKQLNGHHLRWIYDSREVCNSIHSQIGNCERSSLQPTKQSQLCYETAEYSDSMLTLCRIPASIRVMNWHKFLTCIYRDMSSASWQVMHQYNDTWA